MSLLVRLSQEHLKADLSSMSEKDQSTSRLMEIFFSNIWSRAARAQVIHPERAEAPGAPALHAVLELRHLLPLQGPRREPLPPGTATWAMGARRVVTVCRELQYHGPGRVP